MADVFEALTSKRHYRDPMDINEAFEHLLQNIGVHFDKKCVEALISYYNNSNSDEPYLPSGNLVTLKLLESNNDIINIKKSC